MCTEEASKDDCVYESLQHQETARSGESEGTNEIRFNAAKGEGIATCRFGPDRTVIPGHQDEQK